MGILRNFGKEKQIAVQTKAVTRWNRKGFLDIVSRSLIYLVISVGAILILIPVAWMITTGLKEPHQAFIFPPEWIPSPIAWQNFSTALSTLPFHIFFVNSTIISLSTMLGAVISSAFVAYGFARFRFPGRDTLFVIVLATLILPVEVILIPLFILFKTLNWLDSFKPLIIPSFFGGGAFNIFLMRQFIMTVPRELDDAAKMDGCNSFKTWWKIILPLIKPALIAVAILTFTGHWNQFLEPLIFISSEVKHTVALGLMKFQGVYVTQWNLVMAAATVAFLPPVVVFFVAQKYFIRGIVMTGMKG